jgi:hypothetical protein
MCYTWGEGGSAARAQFFLIFFILSTSRKRNGKNTRTSMVAAVTSLPRVCFFIFLCDSGLVLKNVFENIFLGAFSPIIFIFHFRALLAKEMEKEHKHTTVAAVGLG